jgi:hypothetical protein
LAPGVSLARIAASFRGAYAPLAELDGFSFLPLAQAIASTPPQALRCFPISVNSARRHDPSTRHLQMEKARRGYDHATLYGIAAT